MLLTVPSYNLESSECSSPVIQKCTVVSQLFFYFDAGKTEQAKERSEVCIFVFVLHAVALPQVL